MTTRGVNVFEILSVTFVTDGAKAFVHHDFGKAYDGIERGANFMANFGEKFGFRDRGFLGGLLGSRKFFGGALPGGHVAQDDAELLAVFDASHSDIERNKPPLTNAPDHFVTGIEDTGTAAVRQLIQVPQC